MRPMSVFNIWGGRTTSNASVSTIDRWASVSCWSLPAAKPGVSIQVRPPESTSSMASDVGLAPMMSQSGTGVPSVTRKRLSSDDLPES